MLTKEDWLTAEVKSRYGDCLRRQGRYDAAESILLASAADVEKSAGSPEWSRSASRRRVAELYEAMGKADRAAEWKKRADEGPAAGAKK
jgi:hypothetical protein